MKGRTSSTLSRTKYVKYFRVETSCYRVLLRLKFIVTVELLYDQAESDFPGGGEGGEKNIFLSSSQTATAP